MGRGREAGRGPPRVQKQVLVYGHYIACFVRAVCSRNVLHPGASPCPIALIGITGSLICLRSNMMSSVKQTWVMRGRPVVASRFVARRPAGHARPASTMNQATTTTETTYLGEKFQSWRPSGEGVSSRPLPVQVRSLNHVAVPVKDLDAATHWYHKVGRAPIASRPLRISGSPVLFCVLHPASATLVNVPCHAGQGAH